MRSVNQPLCGFYTLFFILLFSAVYSALAFSPQEKSRLAQAHELFRLGKPVESRRLLHQLKESNETAFFADPSSLRMWGFLELAEGRNGYEFLEKSEALQKDPAVSMLLGMHFFASPRHRLSREFLADSLMIPGTTENTKRRRPLLAGNIPSYCPTGDPGNDLRTENAIAQESVLKPEYMKYAYGYLPAESELLFASLLTGLPVQYPADLPEPFNSPAAGKIFADPDSPGSYDDCINNLYKRIKLISESKKRDLLSEMLGKVLRIRAERSGNPGALLSYAEFLLDNGHTFEALHVLRRALESAGFYRSDGTARLTVNAEILLSLKRAYETLRRNQDAMTAEKFLLLTELEAARKNGAIRSYREAFPYLTEDEFHIGMIKTASENLNNREALRYLMLNTDGEKSLRYSEKLKNYDMSAGVSEMQDLYRNYP